MMWEEYKFAAHHWREKMPPGKVQLELNMAGDVEQQKEFLKNKSIEKGSVE